MKQGMVITALAGSVGNLIMAFVSLLLMRIIGRVYGNMSGVAAKLFSLAGPVLVYGTCTSILVGLLSLLFP